jgi:hypothetical protein
MMTTITNDPDSPNLAMLEEMLSAVHVLTLQDHPTLAEVMGDAARVCQTRHAVHAGITLQLQGALTSLRTGRPEDAIGYIERAIDIEERWTGVKGNR